MPNQNSPTQNPNPLNSSSDSVTPSTSAPVISPQADLPPLPPAFQNMEQTAIPTEKPAAADDKTHLSDSGSGAPPETSSVTSKPKKKFGGGRIIATILGLFLLVGGIGAGVLVTQQKQVAERAVCTVGYVNTTGTCCSNGKSERIYRFADCTTENRCDGADCTGSTPNSCGANGGSCQSSCSNGSASGTCPSGYTCCKSGGNPAPPPGGNCDDCDLGSTSSCTTSNNTAGTKTCVTAGSCSSKKGNWGACVPNATGSCTASSSVTTLGTGTTVTVNPGQYNCSNQVTKTCPAGQSAFLARTASCVCSINCVPGGSDCSAPGAGDCSGQTGDCYVSTHIGVSIKDGCVCSNPHYTTCATGYKCSVPLNQSTTAGDCVQVATTPPSAPPNNPTAPSCVAVKAYSSTWTVLTSDQLTALTTGAQINFCVSGANGTFDMADFKIGSTVEANTTTKGQGAVASSYCQSYTIQSTDTTISVSAKIHDTVKGWVGESF